MKKKQLQPQHDINKDLQIIKAVAQAWHSHSGTSRSTNEFDAYPRRHFKARPSRFKLEAMSNPSVKLKDERTSIANTPHWDFAQSLWDSYELVTLAKKLETALVLDDPFSAAGSELEGNSSRAQKRGKESKNSLRNLLKRVSSRRFVEADIKIPREDNNVRVGSGAKTDEPFTLSQLTIGQDPEGNSINTIVA
ncbi:hypothetical protein GOBAR_AA11839 [Gossypium barbadense]|uniref:Uncharacterized protein n=1 Tax=Gossypium barbadense TaxID=3634 RepID=A0A2P5XZT0_GOSBA|nr:hypothetical protein GOBAR_AA11839 [Gossypium barbadense]